MSIEVNNSASRIWDNEELKQTLKECKSNGFVISTDGYLKVVTDPTSGNNVLVSTVMRSNTNLVRIDKTYFKS